MMFKSKSFRALTLATLTTFSVSVSRPSHALVAVGMLEPAMILAGIGIAGAGAIGIVGGYKLSKSESILKQFGGYVIGIAGTLTSGYGLLILDGESVRMMEFSELSSETSANLGLTPAEVASYHAELDQVNFLLAEVHGELSSIKKPTVTDSAEAWAKVKDSVSPETFSALEKISSQLL